jgi:hypothetical protein
MREIGRLRNGTPIGGWLLKARPDVWDLPAYLAAGNIVESWSLVDSYRLELLAPGQPCVLWMTGATGSRPTPGLWAMGELTGEPELGDADGLDGDGHDGHDGDDGFWLSDGERDRPRPRIAVRLDFFDPPIPRAVFTDDPRLARAEIFRAPRAGNPVAFTPAELACIREITDGHDLR